MGGKKIIDIKVINTQNIGRAGEIKIKRLIEFLKNSEFNLDKKEEG